MTRGGWNSREVTDPAGARFGRHGGRQPGWRRRASVDRYSNGNMERVPPSIWGAAAAKGPRTSYGPHLFPLPFELACVGRPCPGNVRTELPVRLPHYDLDARHFRARTCGL